MTPTKDWLRQAEARIRHTLDELQPQLLETQGKIEHKIKDDKSAVTEMDILVEERLRDVLQEFDAGVGFAGEETGADYEQDTFWLTDPIDGTESFTRGIPFATNMIALISSGQPILAIVKNFTLGEYYLAIKGEGATRNGHAIKVSDRPLSHSYIVVTGGTGKLGAPDLRRQIRPHIAGRPKLHASGYEAALIAAGAFDGAVVAGAKGPWDFAAGCLLIQEAGGRVENFGIKGYDYRDMRFVAANPVIFDELKRFVEQGAGQVSAQ